MEKILTWAESMKYKLRLCVKKLTFGMQNKPRSRMKFVKEIYSSPWVIPIKTRHVPFKSDAPIKKSRDKLPILPFKNAARSIIQM